MSVIHYKFKSLKDFDTYTFEGAGVPVWELKQEIIGAKKLNRANDFDLILANAQTHQEYTDDMTIIPKNSSVIVRRVPAAPGRRFYQPRTLHAPTAGMFSGMRPPQMATGTASTGLGSEETSKIASMMTESSSHWSMNQQMPSQAQFSTNRKFFRPKGPVIPPPSNYVCFRCGQKGHYIGNCPTNADPNFNRPKIRKTTGIPKSFLKPIERSETDSVLPAGNVLLTAEGDLVMAAPNEFVWNQLASGAKTALFADDSMPSHFKCLLCQLTLNDPVYFSCCPGTNYCDECIRGALLRHETTTCRGCRRAVSIEDLVNNTALAQEIADQLGNWQGSAHKRGSQNDLPVEGPKDTAKRARTS